MTVSDEMTLFVTVEKWTLNQLTRVCHFAKNTTKRRVPDRSPVTGGDVCREVVVPEHVRDGASRVAD